jgi:hypothetical protein
VPNWGGVQRYSGGKPGERAKAETPKGDQYFAGGVADEGLKKRR